MAETKVTSTEIETQQAWQAPTFQNSWVNYGSTFANAGYFKDSLGIVHLQGLVKNGTVTTTIFTLPVGYRPLGDLRYTADSNGAYGIITVAANGAVAQTGGTNAWISLAGITFRAEQ